MSFGLPLIIVLNILIAVIGWIQYREYREKQKFHVRTTPDRRKSPSTPLPTLRTVNSPFAGGIQH